MEKWSGEELRKRLSGAGLCPNCVLQDKDPLNVVSLDEPAQICAQGDDMAVLRNIIPPLELTALLGESSGSHSVVQCIRRAPWSRGKKR